MRALYALLLLVIIIFACKKKKDNTPQGPNEVWLLYKRFNPTLMETKKGTTISFVNKDNADHTATQVGSGFASGKIKSGNKWDHTFADTGYYSIYCNYHPDNLTEQLYLHVKAN